MAQDEPYPGVVVQYNELGQLAAGVGHHVINAFSAIVSNAELLRLVEQAPGKIDPIMLADVIVKTALDASAVARRLIDYSRTATATGGGQVQLDRLAAAIAEEETAQGRRNIEWVTELVPVPPVQGNELQIRDMLRHIITNAYEAMPPSGGTITLVTGRDARGWVVLEVRDTGQGLPTHHVERAVEPFFTTKAGHFGVGLSIANGIWRRHRGTLAVRSQAGQGTTVRLCVEPNRAVELPTPVPGSGR
jgi:signal transduction histidine kinase